MGQVRIKAKFTNLQFIKQMIVNILIFQDSDNYLQKRQIGITEPRVMERRRDPSPPSPRRDYSPPCDYGHHSRDSHGGYSGCCGRS
ncbi:hypothetical protein FGO68_gene16941 [Halteria grandinella]|uniref:Uncharacterized protein n=1 Tax=Halteria grandinella TaxID=5974 RepID=A0A8J8SZT2_HALGN|nr:hypothetical protein FGO68_gene16941 [Halteria grandinella]